MIFPDFLIEKLTSIYTYCFILNRFAFRFNNGSIRSIIHYMGLAVSIFPLAAHYLSSDKNKQAYFKKFSYFKFFIFSLLEFFRFRSFTDTQKDYPFTIKASLKPEIWPFTSSDLVISCYSFKMKHLFGPLKAVLITDLHFSGHLSSDYYDNLADVIKKLNPDILFLGGDHIHSLEYLKGLKGFLLKTASYDYKLGKYAVLGNHDFAHGPLQVRQALKESGFICLGGKNRIIKNRDKKFVLKGNEGPWGMDAPGHELPGIALCHTIDNMHNFAKNNVHLALAGHFHDGQIKIPFFGPLLIPSVHGRAFSKGSFNFEGTRIAVSSGAGLSGPKFRISSQPEVVFINIK